MTQDEQLAIDNLQLKALVEARFEQSMAVPTTFFEAEAERIAEACWAMAKRFYAGGRLLAFGNGGAATDAQHVSVEFVHPVIVGKRALPALALTNDSASMSALSTGSASGVPFARRIALLARPHDMSMGFSPDGRSLNVIEALLASKQRGLLTLGMAGGDGGEMKQAGLDFCFVVPSGDAAVVQETHETLYHVLWELVHVFFEHEGLLA
jgi:D-sedoheptulose 7-phosphate isomerase